MRKKSLKRFKIPDIFTKKFGRFKKFSYLCIEINIINSLNNRRLKLWQKKKQVRK